MDIPTCEEYVKKLLSSGDAKRFHDSIQAKMRFTVQCCDCSRESGVASTFARAYFSAPHLEDTESTDVPSVTLCTNSLPDKEQVGEALTHELVHAYDHCVARRDLTDCEALACSEVRAAREAECKNSFNGGPGEFCRLAGFEASGLTKPDDAQDALHSKLFSVCRWFKRRCAERNAIKSVDAVFPGDGARCVAAVLERCFVDHHPFNARDSAPSRVDHEDQRLRGQAQPTV